MSEQETTRFAYVPIGATFRVGTHGTVDFVKVDEDHGLTNDGVDYRFELSDKCRIVTPPNPVEAAQEKWECSAHKPNYFGGDPQDCNWPHCGCDPHVDRVISGLEECGYEITPPRPLEPKPATQVEMLMSHSEWWPHWVSDTEGFTEHELELCRVASEAAWNAAKSQSLPVVEKLVSLDEVLTLIENEPVLPGELPDEIKQRLNGLYLELALGIAVVGTKNSLTHKLRKLSAEKETGR